VDGALVELFVHCQDLLKARIVAAAKSYPRYRDNGQQPFFHMSSDSWGSKYQRRNYTTIVGAWLSKDWQLQLRTITTAACPGAKTAENVSRWLKRKLRRSVDVDLDQCASVTSDAGSDMK
jgi:hypothetical protein